MSVGASSVAAVPRPEPEQVRAPSAVTLPAVRRYVAGALVVGALVVSLAVALHVPSEPSGPRWVVVPLLVLGFVLADALQITIEVRRGAVALPLSDFPLLAALVLVDVRWAVAATALAVLGRAARLRQHPTITAFNVASASVEVAVAYLVADRVVGAGWRLPLGLFLGLVAATLVSTAVAVGLSTVMGGRGGVRGHLRVATTYLVLGLLNPVVALAALALVRTGPTGWVLLVGVVVTLVIAYRSYATLLRERHDLDLVHEIVVAVAAEGDDPQAGWRAVAELVRQQFNAARVVLRVPDGGGVVVLGTPLPAGVAEGLTAGVAGGPEDPVGAAVGTEPVVLRHQDAPPRLRAAMAARGAAEALVARLGDGAGAGLLEVHDRQHQSRGFGAVDVRLLSTLVRQLGTAVDNRRLVARLREDAYRDRVTGMSNRLGLQRRSTELLGRGGPVAVLVADLGALRDVNDALGHEVGDRFVVEAGLRLDRAVVRSAGAGTLTAHVGGERFAALLVGPAAVGAAELAAELAVVLGEPYRVQDIVVEAEPALGVATAAGGATAGATDVERLLQQADVAVAEARSGSGPVLVHHPEMGQKFLRRFQLVAQFRSSLAAGEVQVHYQPQISLRTRELVGAEALVRWRHPELGDVDPGELVRVLEASGLMDALTAHVLDDAVARCAGWQHHGPGMGVAVNVSVRNLLSDGFPATVAATLARHGLPAGRLTLEITETSVMGDAERTLPVLRRLHGLGVRLAVDDFGTGYSSLSYLRKLPVDEVKIDKSFVLAMDTDLADQAVVRAIIDLGRSLGLTVVAEGVETDVVREQLAVLGADLAQGFLVARAMPPERFETWRRTRRLPDHLDLGRELSADLPADPGHERS